MSKKLIIMLGIIMVIVINIFLTSCSRQNEKTSNDETNTIVEDDSSKITQFHKDIMYKYITDFLTPAYSKYYIVNSVKCEFNRGNIKDNKIEALITTVINSNVPPKDPDTVQYIKDAKESAQNETNLERKKVLQHEYETLASEYGKPNDTYYIHKFTANLINNEIDTSSIKLYAEIDALRADGTQTVDYIPAEGLLPGK